MYLKSITLKGFKSFPDRTKLEFAPGVSVIVGPNGSGKSNVTDAVLWALGEQSPLAVRGQSMQDVIFGGAPGRQAARSAEVEMVLDDGDDELGLGVPEISIMRRLERSGEGEYRLAGARCRLVDVTELLSDTGLGKEMHSVISQGRVESIVTSKPRDRRLLIEEAAGLGKHRKRRRRAQLKLDHTTDNLHRALDVEREARSRLRPLKRQAEAAELHDRLHRQMLEVRYELARDELRGRRSGLELAQNAVATARAARVTLERELDTVANARQAAEEALAGRSACREELSRRRFAAQSAGERVSYRAEAVTRAGASVGARLARARERLEQLTAHEPAPVPDRHGEARIVELRRELEALARDREAELARQLQELERQQLLAGEQEASLAESAQRARELRDRSETAFEAARGGVREAERAVEQARRNAARVGGELAACNQFLRSHSAAPGGARSLADAIAVAPGFELAVAAALDGRLGAALVDDRDAAGTLLDRSGSDGGRVLVIGAQAFRADAAEPSALPPGAERLADQIRGDGQACELARALLRDAWVVKSLQAVPAVFTGVAVTCAGRVWSASASEVRQAAAVGEDRVLAERNRREQLIAASEQAAQAEQRARGSLEQAAAQAGLRDGEREHAISADREAVRRRDEATEQQRRLVASIARRRGAPDEGPGAGRRAQLHAEIVAEEGKLERAAREQAQRAAAIGQLRGAIASDAALAPEISALVEVLGEVGAAIAQRQSEFDAALAADRAAGEHVAAQLRSCAQQEASLQSSLHADNEALTALEVRAQRARDQAGDAEGALGRLAAELELEASPATEGLADGARAALSARLERLERRREQLGPVNPLAQDEYQEALAHVEELERQRTDLETALRELEKLIRDTDRQIREIFERTFQAASANFEELSARLFPGGSGRLRLVAEQPGPALLLGGAAAVGADADGVERAGAASDDQLEDEARGGEDLLGVEIEITPAGKAMKRLSLLSGGEKSMTALAFLFSVFLARPCPFYILDEVEAALDDLNIDRFLDLLGSYSRRAQFIVVTHQKRTMEIADSLYGVSMGGDGISKVISRRLPAREAAAEAC
ncbi:MAG: chromosome segregation SMC family protein [Solirubrobacteraceae bacterium]